MRFAEIAMLALPFVVFVAWRLVAPSAGPPRSLVIAVAGTVVAMAGLLLVLWYQEAEPPSAGYVPAQLEDGRILPSGVAPVAPGRAGPVAPGRAETVAPGGAETVAPGRAGPVAPGGAETVAPRQASPVNPVPK